MKRPRPAWSFEALWKAALRQGIACACGCGRMVYRANVNCDHRPPLSERKYDPKSRRYEPHANHPDFIAIMINEHHDIRTYGTKATSQGSDAHNRAHEARLKSKHQAHLEAMRKKAGQ